MDYRDAIEIARKVPGTLVTRDEYGGFIVRRADGSLVEGHEPASDEITLLRQENERYQNNYDELFAQLNQTKQNYLTKLTGLEETIDQLKSSLNTLQAEHSSAINNLKELEKKLAKVSNDEWERIKIADEQARLENAKARKAERHIQQCACLGEVENCARCNGRGSYTADGYGNPI
ncbi:hypothetical protein PSEUDO8BK_30611 [Pseudomonas sp. 8BK]|uniref:hypothetical protein n=1 Tax=Pseudomonas sp. 8BK TaxID=2653164 RepID=UPI0012F0FA5C|nr:hypothetical protein [Pseudomonas sp. 8BK]VXB54074.1 hypothetical protein PSEUDO8BK_30611 [Pseudomonas sp. 8BK]